jgi:MFS family permease
VQSNYPSLVIGFWICVAFVAGRLAARFGRRWRTAVRVAVTLVAVALATYVFWFRITWHAALIPAALLLGVFTYGHQKMAPGVFK